MPIVPRRGGGGDDVITTTTITTIGMVTLALRRNNHGGTWQAVTSRHIELLHSPRLVAIGLTISGVQGLQLAGITILWLVGLNIDWGCLVPHCIMGSRNQLEFPPFSRPQGQSLCTALTTGKCLSLGLCKGTVKESKGISSALLHYSTAFGLSCTCPSAVYISMLTLFQEIP